MNHQETLDIVNKFMERSGIHEYCVKTCKGKCCAGCYEQHKFSCHNVGNDTGRLSCMIHSCRFLDDIMEKAGIRYSFARLTVLRTIRASWPNIRDIFHYPMPKMAEEAFEVEERFIPELLNVLSDENADRVREVLYG